MIIWVTNYEREDQLYVQDEKKQKSRYVSSQEFQICPPPPPPQKKNK